MSCNLSETGCKKSYLTILEGFIKKLEKILPKSLKDL